MPPSKKQPPDPTPAPPIVETPPSAAPPEPVAVPVENLTATRDLLGWHGERILAGMSAPVADWPDEYVQHLVAEGTLQIEGGDFGEAPPSFIAPDLTSPETPVVRDLREPNEAPKVVDVAGDAERPERGGEAR